MFSIFGTFVFTQDTFAQNQEPSDEVSPITLVGQVNVSSLKKNEASIVQSNEIPFLSKDLDQVVLSQTLSAAELASRDVHVNIPPLITEVTTADLNFFTGFEGLDEITTGFNPPDVQVAVGPDHVFEMVNSHGEIWTKAGVSLGNFPLNLFFLIDPLANPPIDPKIAG